MTEFFDEVDQNDQILGQITRAEAHKHNIMHRAVHIFIQNESDYGCYREGHPIKIWTR